MNPNRTLLPDRMLRLLQKSDSAPAPEPFVQRAFAARTLAEIHSQHSPSPYNPFAVDRSEDVYIYMLDPAYLTERHVHAHFEVVYVLSGEMVNRIDDEEFLLHPGDICLVGRDVQHELAVADGEPPEAVSLVLMPSALEGTLCPYLHSEGRIPELLRGGGDRCMYYAFQAHSPLQMIFTGIIDEYTSSGFMRTFALDALLLLLLSSMERQGETRIGSFSEILSYILEHCTHETINDIARHFNYTPNYFSRLVKRRTGQNCKAFMKEARLRMALTLLAEDTLSTDEIAERIGYRSTSHFFKVFREQYGITPKQYRETVGG